MDKLTKGAFVAQAGCWTVCGVVVFLGGLLFLVLMGDADSAIQEAATAAFFAAIFIGVYVLARVVEKVAGLVISWKRDARHQ